MIYNMFILEKSKFFSVNISSGHYTYGIKFEKPSEPTGTFQIYFWYFMFLSMRSLFMKIFKMSQTEVALNMKVFLNNIPCTDKQDIDFEKTTT